jgi:hypothetical protein
MFAALPIESTLPAWHAALEAARGLLRNVLMKLNTHTEKKHGSNQPRQG